MQFCSGGDVMDKLKKLGRFDEKYCKILFFQMVYAISALHSKGVAHRDIKPGNFMFVDDKHEKIKLIDFGLSKSFRGNSKLKTVLGTPFYVAPEVISNDEKSEDNYSE